MENQIPQIPVVWTKEQIENFFREETNLSDDKCAQLASTLSNYDRLNLLLSVKPEDYTIRKV